MRTIDESPGRDEAIDLRLDRRTAEDLIFALSQGLGPGGSKGKGKGKGKGGETTGGKGKGKG